jgi:hypothetical protein
VARLPLAAFVVLAFVLAPAASTRNDSVAPGSPHGLRAFLLRADETVAHQYSRTPSFTWAPVSERGGHYQFELSTSPQFDDASLVFKDTRVPFPVITVPRQLPWMTGDPYALWAHVRWISADGQRATRWSAPFGFNLQWDPSDVPQQLSAPEGLIRWAPVEGATGYQVLYLDIHPLKAFETNTNVADEREYFTFHSALGYSMTIHWRVRAIRDVGSLGLPSNGLPAVSYGPWSPVFTTTNAPQSTGTLAPSDTVSNAWQTSAKAAAFELTPGFAWHPSDPVVSDNITVGSSLYRVYIATDKNCVNRVFTGSIVGSPAWAPRVIGGPIKLPTDTKVLATATAGTYPGAGSEGTALDAVGDAVSANEGLMATGKASAPAAGSGSSAGSSGSAASSSAAGGAAGGSTSTQRAPVELWDSGWPSGRYYWTVVPVTAFALQPPDPTQTNPVISIGYQDAAVPQDACEAGDMMSFGKVTAPVVTSSGRPFVSGVSPSSRFVASAGLRPAVASYPLIAWEPAVGATRYQVEVSRSLYPWRAVNTLGTPATSMILPLSRMNAGVWFYRVRGINEALPVGAQRMGWSQPVRIQITGERFAIVK